MIVKARATPARKNEIEALVHGSATARCGERSFADRARQTLFTGKDGRTRIFAEQACQTALFADKDCQTTTFANQACQTIILANKACQTPLDLVPVSEKLKESMIKLTKRIALQGEMLRKLRADRDRMKKRLSTYENTDVEVLLQTLQNTQKIDKASLE